LVVDVVAVDWCRQARKVVVVDVRDGRAACSRGRAKALANAERENMVRSAELFLQWCSRLGFTDRLIDAGRRERKSGWR
jgi:Holliday junction resolvase-like predicted endonuclease